MQDKQRQQRKAKRAESKKKKRANASRPGVGGPVTVGSESASKGRTWPTGECYVSEGWDEPGARIDAVFSRSRPDGATVLAVFELDRSGPGLLGARARGGLRREHVASECAAVSERSGQAMIGCAPGLVAALVDDARGHGAGEVAASALELLEGVPRIELPVPFGPAAAPEAAPEGDGWFGGLRKRLLG
ncbi:MAG: hypothetical protein R3F59_20950 [Myxococcota bacterium]